MDGTKHFKQAGEVTADERGRLAFGKAGVRRGDRYAVGVSDDGEILLTPLVSVNKRELLVWENRELRASLGNALAQSAEGSVATYEYEMPAEKGATPREAERS